MAAINQTARRLAVIVGAAGSRYLGRGASESAAGIAYRSVLPVDSRDVTEAIHNIATPASAAGLLSLIVLVWAASGMMAAMRAGLERTMDVEHRRGLAFLADPMPPVPSCVRPG